MPEQISLVANAHGARHVRAGQILRVVKPHPVLTITRLQQHDVHMREIDGRPTHALPRGSTATAGAGDLALELVDIGTDRLFAIAYLTGPASQLHGYTGDEQGTEAWFEPARIERLSKIERFIEEMGLDAPDDRIQDLQELAIAEMQRARHGDGDIAFLDIEAGDQYRNCIHVVNSWWNDYEAGQDALAALDPKPEIERTCHLFARICRRRALTQAKVGRYRRHPGVAWIHAQPKKHAGWPPATAFHMQAVLEARLAS